MSSASHSFNRCFIRPVAASPASFQPSKAASITGSLPRGCPSRRESKISSCSLDIASSLDSIAEYVTSCGSNFAQRARFRAHLFGGAFLTTAPAAVLWDMDGTLVDTEAAWIGAEVDLVAQHGKGPWTQEDGLQLVGQALPQVAKILQERAEVRLETPDILEYMMS